MQKHYFRLFDQNTDRLAFGCSHTWGAEVEFNETWAYHVNAKNYGVGGASSDLIVRIAADIIDNEHPSTVFLLWPDWSRFEHFQNGEYIQILPKTRNRIQFMHSHNEQWCKSNFLKNVEKMHKICNDRSVQLIDMTLYDLIPYMDYADRWPISKYGSHYAPEWHQKVANLFLWAKENNHKFPLAHD
jgi:hypothetical protein